jgi:asparagine synthase (glutamine-hydrolysing)
MNRISKDIQTFTVVLDPKNPDAIFSRKAAELFGSTHHEVEIGNEELPELIYHVLSNQPLPFGDSSIVPAYALAKYAKQFVKVLISGDGADEVLSGYEYYRKYGNESQKSPKLHFEYLRLKTEMSILRWLFARKDFLRVNRFQELKFILSKQRAIDLWHEDISILNDQELKRMGFSRKCVKKSRREFSQFSGIQSVMQWDRFSYLPGDILWKSDTAGMMASLEVRTPFLNSNLVNWAREIDFTQRISKQTLLMKEYEGQIPSEFFTRKKQGFGAPLKKWLEIPEVNNLFMDTVGNKQSKLYKYINFRKGIKASKINSQTKWNLLALGLWLEKND